MFFWYISFASTELVCSKITTFYFLSRFLLLPSFLTCTLCSISCSRQLILNKIIDYFLAGRRWICTCIVLASRVLGDISPPSTLNITSPLFAWLPFDHCCSNSHVSREFTSRSGTFTQYVMRESLLCLFLPFLPRIKSLFPRKLFFTRTIMIYRVCIYRKINELPYGGTF